MHSLSLSKFNSAPPMRPGILEQAWLPSALETNAPVNTLDAALQALTEAERVIRTQAEHILRLESLAMTDELTGLMNRRAFNLTLQRELAVARRDPAAAGALVMVDLDGFKSINDRWGHSVGDDYLQAVAHTLLGSVRASDSVARLGGDEFALLFTRMPEAAGRERLATLEKSFNSCLMPFGDMTLPLRASFGLVPYTGTDHHEALMISADVKLYAHKARRRAEA